MSLFSRQPSAIDVLTAQVVALSQQVGTLQGQVQALLATATPATAPMQPVITPTELPETPSMAPVWAVLQQLAPDEGPFRRVLQRTAAGLLLDPNNTPESVADLLMRGSDDDE